MATGTQSMNCAPVMPVSVRRVNFKFTDSHSQRKEVHVSGDTIFSWWQEYLALADLQPTVCAVSLYGCCLLVLIAVYLSQKHACEPSVLVLFLLAANLERTSAVCGQLSLPKLH